MLNDYLWFSKDYIKVGYIGKDQTFVEETHNSLGEAFISLYEYFKPKEKFPSIRAVIVPDRNEFDRIVKELLKVDIETPSRSSRIAQTQKTDIVILSPSAYKRDSIYEYRPDEYRRLLFHEATHVMEEYISPNIETQQRWWSEGLAVNLSTQWRYEDEFREPVLKGLKNKQIPNFKEIQEDVRLSYQWGWTIVKYIEELYTPIMIAKIVKACENGDVFNILGKDIKSLEKEWKKWLTNKEKGSYIEKNRNCWRSWS